MPTKHPGGRPTTYRPQYGSQIAKALAGGLSAGTVAAQVIADFAAYKGVANQGSLPAEAIVARLLYPVVNECAKVVEEGVAIRASDVASHSNSGTGKPCFGRSMIDCGSRPRA